MTRTKLAPIGALLVLLLFAIAGRGHDASAQVDAPGLTPARIRAALARYRDEPSVDAVVQAALDAPQLDPDRARDAADRARLAGSCPRRAPTCGAARCSTSAPRRPGRPTAPRGPRATSSRSAGASRSSSIG